MSLPLATQNLCNFNECWKSLQTSPDHFCARKYLTILHTYLPLTLLKIMEDCTLKATFGVELLDLLNLTQVLFSMDLIALIIMVVAGASIHRIIIIGFQAQNTILYTYFPLMHKFLFPQQVQYRICCYKSKTCMRIWGSIKIENCCCSKFLIGNTSKLFLNN